MGSRFAVTFLPALILLLCVQGLASASDAAAPPLSDQVSGLLRQQLEPWKTPPPAAAPVATPELVGPPAPAEAGKTPEAAPALPPDFVGPPGPANPPRGIPADPPTAAPPTHPA